MEGATDGGELGNKASITWKDLLTGESLGTRLA